MKRSGCAAGAHSIAARAGMMVSRLKFYIVLFVLPVVLKFTARRHPAFAARLKAAQPGCADQGARRGDRTLDFNSRRRDQLRLGHAREARRHTCRSKTPRSAPRCSRRRSIGSTRSTRRRTSPSRSTGPEDLTNWFAQTLMMMQTAGLEIRRPPCPTAPCATATWRTAARSSSTSRTARSSARRRSTSTKPIRSRGQFMRAE